MKTTKRNGKNPQRSLWTNKPESFYLWSVFAISYFSALLALFIYLTYFNTSILEDIREVYYFISTKIDALL